MQKSQKASRQGDRNDMTRFVCGIALALLFLLFSFPASGKNYLLHSPKLWSPEEKERLEKENLTTIREMEPVDKQVDKQKGLAEKQKVRVKKEKELLEKQKERRKIEQERVNREKELAEKQKAQLEKQREQIKKEKEQIRKEQILVKDGVSYREVTVQKGDTLYDITRKYSKEGSSYAETLRFNNLKDPDEIVIGDIVKVPLNRGKKAQKPNQAKQIIPAAPVQKQQVTAKAAPKTVPAITGIPQPPIFSSNSTSRQKAGQAPEISTPPPIQPGTQKQQTTSIAPITSGQKLFEQAIKSYRTGDCQTAIQIFSQFLAEDTTSKLAADASLLIADCYLKLSGK